MLRFNAFARPLGGIIFGHFGDKVGRKAVLTTTLIMMGVATTGIGPQWYAIPVLVLSALRAALQEEVIVVGFLFARLRDLRWSTPAIIATSAVLRGSYHLYQGFGGFVGNALMGVVFGVLYQRFGRVAPLVVAHFVLDFVSFVGYDLLRTFAPGLLPGR